MKMNWITRLLSIAAAMSAFALVPTTARGQEPPARPARPTPDLERPREPRAARPELAPRSAPAPLAFPDARDLDFDLHRNEFELRQHELQMRSDEMQQRQELRMREQEERIRETEERVRERTRETEERMRERMRDDEERIRDRVADRMLDRIDLAGPRAMRMDMSSAPALAPMAPLTPLTPLSPRPELAPALGGALLRDSWVPGDMDGGFLNRRPREPWVQGDPADSLYRAAREALNRGEYRRAAGLFNEVTRRYPNSAYSADCGYWEAFSRYRIGSTEELKAAARALDALSSRSGQLSRDIDIAGLRTRIGGALAVRGDNDEGKRLIKMAGADRGAVEMAGEQACDREDLTVRVEALNALSQMDAAAALPILRRVLERKDECLTELRRRAVFMLARRADTAAANVLIIAAKNDPSPTVRAEAIGYLPRMPGDVATGALEEILRTADDERVQRAAVRALLSSESPRARTSLRALIERKDAPERMRMEAIGAFDRERSTPDDAAYLRSLYGKLESERLKDAVISSLARIGGKENQDWLAALVRNQNESYQMRSAALSRLSRSDIPVADLSKMYDAADSRSMREQLISALASRKENEATDKLIDIAKAGTDPYMRRMAINYLSRRNDPRTQKLLMELIEK